jgi:riboflavin kinase/FMN adenylyltransferase
MMRVAQWKDLLGQEGSPLPVALTIGNFDSLHIGHQRLMRAVVENDCGAVASVCTFTRNPAAVLGSRPFPGSILSFDQKIEKLESLGIALVVLIDFSLEISKLAGKSFLDLLAGRLDIKKLVVGYDFHMGRGRDTDPRELVRILTGSGTDLEIIPASTYLEKTVSSSRIRELIIEGRLAEAKEMLKDDFRLDLRGVPIQRRGSDSWVQRSAVRQVLPRHGTYEVLFAAESGEFPGAITIKKEGLSWQREFAGAEKEIRFLTGGNQCR